MNRREFLQGLLSLPLGWKALFKKEKESPLQYFAGYYDGNDGEIKVWIDGKPAPNLVPGTTNVAWLGIEDMDRIVDKPDYRPASFTDEGIGLYPQDWQLDPAPMRVEYYGTGLALYTPDEWAPWPIWYKLVEKDYPDWHNYLFIYWELIT